MFDRQVVGGKRRDCRGPGEPRTGVGEVAYLFGFFCTVIKGSPSADEGDGGLATGAVGMRVGLSPSIERGEEGWTGPEVRSTFCGTGFLRT
jgi:hypothetical protein